MSKKSQAKRQAIDPIFKQVITDELTALGASLQTEVEVSRLPRTIDALLTVETESERRRIDTETPFFYALRANQIEFKGRRDRLTVDGYHLIQGRTHLLLSEQRMRPTDMTVTIICAGKPLTVFTYAEKMLQQPLIAVEAGYYRRAGFPLLYLIVINELPIIPKNYPLLVFTASEHKFREFLEQVVTNGDATYLRYAYEVRPKITREVLTMAGISTTLSQADLEFMAKDVGRELIAFLPPEERLAGISIEELWQAIDSGVLLQEISPEHRKVLLELLKMQAAAAHERKRDGNSHAH